MKETFLRLKSLPERKAYWHLNEDLSAYYYNHGYPTFAAIVIKETKRGWTLYTSILTGTSLKMFLPRENWEVLTEKPKLDD